MGHRRQHGKTLLTLCLPAIGATTALILEDVDDALARHIPEAGQAAIRITLAETLNNVIEHAYPADFGAVAIRVALADSVVDVSVIDWGLPYPENALPDGAAPEPGALQEGGYGWFLIRSLVDDVRYTRDGDTNRLHLSLMV